MSDLNFQNLDVAQSDKQPDIPRIVAAATIAPTTRCTLVSGQTQVETITPPTSGYCEVVLIFSDAAPGAFVTTGNILTAYQPIQNRPVTLYYDRVSAKWYVATVA